MARTRPGLAASASRSWRASWMALRVRPRSSTEGMFSRGTSLLPCPPCCCTSPRACAASYSSARRRFACASMSRASACAPGGRTRTNLVPTPSRGFRPRAWGKNRAGETSRFTSQLPPARRGEEPLDWETASIEAVSLGRVFLPQGANWRLGACPLRVGTWKVRQLTHLRTAAARAPGEEPSARKVLQHATPYRPRARGRTQV